MNPISGSALASQIMTGTNELRTVRISGGAFVTVFDNYKKSGAAYAVPNPKAAPSLSALLLKDFKDSRPSALTIKLVGAEPVLIELEKALKLAKLPIEKSVAKTETSIQALFYPSTGRLRLQVSDSSQTSAQGSSKVSFGKKRILVIDDSPTIQKLLKSILESDPDCEVVGAVTLPSQAEEAVKRLKPDVITLDIHMPEMNGVELLRILHPRYGIPTVMITSVSRAESDIVLEALDAGAVDYIQKPSLSEIEVVAPMIIEKVKIAARAKTQIKPAAKSTRIISGPMDMNRIVAIGSSTGGTEALREIFIRLPAEIPPIVVVQHIPAIFSEALARRLNDLCAFTVKEAHDGDELIPGRVLIAPGGRQMEIVRDRDGILHTRVFDGEPVNRHRPSVDVLFDSVAREVESKALGVILTGMGTDGAKGLVKMRERGSHTIAQDEASSVVFGMPREAIRLGAAAEISPLHQISDKMVASLMVRKRSA